MEVSIKLLCPLVSSKTVQFTAREDQKLDLGSISRVFGLDPNTLKLNGHFISRGVDFVASSVTWKSLIGFFSARGLPTGASDSDEALVVSGRLCKIGRKRTGIPEQEYSRDNKKAQLEYGRLFNSDKLNESIFEPVDAAEPNRHRPDHLHLKRKICLEEAIHSKRLRSDETVSGPCERSCSASTIRRFSCISIS